MSDHSRPTLDDQSVATWTQTMAQGRSYQDAWRGFRPLIIQLTERVANARLMEVGGGRRPMFTQEDIRGLECIYTVNDIDERELELAPPWVATLLGDIADPGLVSRAGEEHFDLVFAQMVFEHVERPHDGYANVGQLLAPGGMFVSFIPTLYAFPFLINRVMPEQLSARLLRLLFSNRHPGGVPKFPAYYRWCTSTAVTAKRLKSVGFDEVEIIAFYGHDYYARIPIVRSIAERFWRLARSRDWRAFSSYAYVIGKL